jgi:hypothetical protein
MRFLALVGPPDAVSASLRPAVLAVLGDMLAEARCVASLLFVLFLFVCIFFCLFSFVSDFIIVFSCLVPLMLTRIGT